MPGILGIIDHNDELSIVIKGMVTAGESGMAIPGSITIGKNGGLHFLSEDNRYYFDKSKIANDNNNASNGDNNKNFPARYQAAVVYDGVIDTVADINGNRVKDSGALKNFLIKKLIDHYLGTGKTPEEAVVETVGHIAGSYALAALIAGDRNAIIAVNCGFPLAVGKAYGKNYIGSSPVALASFATCITRMEKGDFVTLEKNQIQLWDMKMGRLKRPLQISAPFGVFATAVKPQFKPQQKDDIKSSISSQPETLKRTLDLYTQPGGQSLFFPDIPFDPACVSQISIITCSSAYYAGMIGKYILEKLARLPVSLEAASEFRYRNAPVPQTGICLFISPMENSPDIVAALLRARDRGHRIIGMLGNKGGGLREYCQALLPNAAGDESGIIPIKSYSSQLLALECLAIFLARARGARSAEECSGLFAFLGRLPGLVQDTLLLEDAIINSANIIKDSAAVFFTGRGMSYPLALSGAWKMKMLAATHTDAISGGEFRNGAFPLLTPHTPVIAIAPSGALFAKTRSDIRDIMKNGGKVIAVTDTSGAQRLQDITPHVLELPTVHPLLAPVINTVALQLLAYHLSQMKPRHKRQGRIAVKSVIIKRKEGIFAPPGGSSNYPGSNGLTLS